MAQSTNQGSTSLAGAHAFIYAGVSYLGKTAINTLAGSGDGTTGERLCGRVANVFILFANMPFDEMPGNLQDHLVSSHALCSDRLDTAVAVFDTIGVVALTIGTALTVRHLAAKMNAH